jgi:hypothetical protein
MLAKVRMDNIEERKLVIEQLLTDLQVISCVLKGEKLIIKNTGELDVDKRYFQSVRRYLSGDSRCVLLTYLNKMFLSIDTETDFLINCYKVNTTEDVHEYITNTLHDFYLNTVNAKKGILNLIETYADDVAVRSRLELYYNILTRKSLNVRQKLGIRTE